VYDQRVDEHMGPKERREAIETAQEARKHVRQAQRLRRQGNDDAADEAYSEAVGEEVNR